MQAMNIGLPTNVTHQGHATSLEDAQSLIEKLMVGGGASLPPPLLPNAGKARLMCLLLSIWGKNNDELFLAQFSATQLIFNQRLSQNP